MNPVLISVIVFTIFWVVGCLIYFNRKNNKPDKVVAKAVIASNSFNHFLPDDNKVKELNVKIVYSDKDDIDQSQLCDLVIKAKDLVNRNIESIAKRKNNIFLTTDDEPEIKKENILEEKEEIILIPDNIIKTTDVNFNKLQKLNEISVIPSSLPIINNDVNENNDIS
jgi:lipopolysaccharide export LptBFGC system permease protein LptF